MTPPNSTPTLIPGTTPDANLVPRPAILFAARARRLRALAADAPLADWLHFVAQLADAQAGVAPVIDAEFGASGGLDARESLSPAGLPGLPVWQRGAALLAERVAAAAHPAAARSAQVFLGFDHAAREGLALRVLGGEAMAADLPAAPLVCAAQELIATAAAALARPQVQSNIAETCPVCDGAALAATLEVSATSGLRYLHCAHCNTAWHHVRAQCVYCHDARDVAYQSLDQGPAPGPWRAETCDACQAYLKIFDRTKVGEIDPVADDLASLALDLALGEAGYRRAGANPYLLLLGEHAAALA